MGLLKKSDFIGELLLVDISKTLLLLLLLLLLFVYIFVLEKVLHTFIDFPFSLH